MHHTGTKNIELTHYSLDNSVIDLGKYGDANLSPITFSAIHLTAISQRILKNYIWKLHINKSDGKRRNTLGCLDQHTCNVLRLWNSRDRETV